MGHANVYRTDAYHRSFSSSLFAGTYYFLVDIWQSENRINKTTINSADTKAPNSDKIRLRRANVEQYIFFIAVWFAFMIYTRCHVLCEAIVTNYKGRLRNANAEVNFHCMPLFSSLTNRNT